MQGNYLTGFSKQQKYRKLLVAPISLRQGMETLIRNEIDNSKKDNKAKIIAKMNSLVDPHIIQLLYEASQAGVKIKLIIRGMCCLIPQKEGLSENITVQSVIGRYLEHSRIFWFYNNNDPKIYIGSADWMRRNLDRRIEAITPIEDKKLINTIENILEIYLKDNLNSWDMSSSGKFARRTNKKQERICSHSQLMSD